MGYYEAPQKVVPAYMEQLMKFTHKDLKAYAKSLGVKCGTTKHTTCHVLMRSGKATLLASLGD